MTPLHFERLDGPTDCTQIAGDPVDLHAAIADISPRFAGIDVVDLK